MTTSRVDDGFEPATYRVVRDVTFASCYVYSPTGSGASSARSRRLCGLLKAADGPFIGRYAQRVRDEVATGSPLRGYLGPEDVLIPVPRSLPPLPGMPWVANRVADALVSQGVGATVWCGLHRHSGVPRSTTAAPGCRPTVGELFDSLAIDPFAIAVPGPNTGRLVLVDDVVSKGRNLLAAAARVREAFPQAQVCAFALLRTMGFVQEVRRFLEPCVGEIQWRAGDARRIP